MAHASNQFDDIQNDASPEFEDSKQRGPDITINTNSMNLVIHNATNVITGNLTVVHHHNRKKKISKEPKKEVTNSNEKMTQLQKESICQEIGNDWKRMGRELGFSKGRLEQWELQESPDYKELNHVILSQWEKDNDVNATCSNLAQIFIKLKRGDLADMLAD